MSKADIQELKQEVAELKIMVDALLKREITPDLKAVILQDEYRQAIRMAVHNPKPLQEILRRHPELAGQAGG